MGCLLCGEKKDLNALPEGLANGVKRPSGGSFIELGVIADVDRLLTELLSSSRDPSLKRRLTGYLFELRSKPSFVNHLFKNPTLARLVSPQVSPRARKRPPFATDEKVIIGSIDKENIIPHLDRSAELPRGFLDSQITHEESTGIDRPFDNPRLCSAKLFLIHIERGKYLTPFLDTSIGLLRDPFVEARISSHKCSLNTSPVLQVGKEKSVVRTTAAKNAMAPVWDQFFEVELASSKSHYDQGYALDLEHSSFSVRLFSKGRDYEEPTQVGEKIKFSFSELLDQRVHRKVIMLKDWERRQVLAEITIRVQLIHDFIALVQRTKDELETRIEEAQFLLKLKGEGSNEDYAIESRLRPSSMNLSHMDERIESHEAGSYPSRRISYGTDTSNYEVPYFIR
eukprot:TRINITY_DN13485_c0_g1_i1.p1 TRINITY_DN13485_c0_g1~~TRINITY_DN13485_c0_g1_i1.p1  ORF type:complete len:397 (-),score=78.52 TRINITY_DN13485_c0_g1_i1:110-1300(-)